MSYSLSRVGLGLRHPHLEYFANEKVILPLLEIHAENFFQKESKEHVLLDKIKQHHPISIHAVGLSLGSTSKPSIKHMRELRRLNQDLKPVLFSEHLSWGKHGKQHFNDLIALPYTKESLELVSRNVDIFQNFLGRQILIENPSSYISFKESTISEVDFLNLLCKKTGCKILLDVNNIFVSAHNINFSTQDYLGLLHYDYISEIHIAGPEEITLKNQETVLIDSHSTYPKHDALMLLKQISRKTKAPIILEWDQDIPEAEELLRHATNIEKLLYDA